MELHPRSHQPGPTSSWSHDAPVITVRELSAAEAAEIALLDLADSDEAWLDEDETTEYAPPATVIEDLDEQALTPLLNLEAVRVDLADWLEPEAGGFDPLSSARRCREARHDGGPWWRHH